MDRQTLGRLCEERAAAFHAMRGILDEVGDGPLSHNQREAFDRNEAKFDRLDAQIKAGEDEMARARGSAPAATVPALTEGDPQDRLASRSRSSNAYRVTGAPGSADGPFLGREERMADWLTARGQDVSAEVRSFSLAKFVRGLAGFGWEDAELEHRAVIESGTDAQGAVIAPVGTAAVVIDSVRERSRVIEAGATLVPMLNRRVTVPKLATGVQAQWRAEMGPVTFQDPTFTAVTLTAQSLAVGITISNELAEDATDPGLRTLENEIIRAVSNGLDLGALRGDGAALPLGGMDDNAPRGIRFQEGVTIRPNGTDGTPITSHAMLVDAAYQVRQRGYTPSAFILSPRSEMKLGTLADNTGQPLAVPPYLASIPRLESLGVPEDLETGANGDTSEIYVGEFVHCYIGVRPRFAVQVQRANNIDNLSTKIVAHLRADVALAHPGAFCVETGVR